MGRRRDPGAVAGRHVTTILIGGPAGIGKSTFVRYLASHVYKCPLAMLNGGKSSTELDLMGGFVVKEGETVFAYGAVPGIIDACNKHKLAILMINEINAFTMGTQMALLPLCDQQEAVTLALLGGELHKVDDDAHLIVLMTMNPKYGGTNQIQQALFSRAGLVLDLDFPDPTMEAQVLTGMTGIPSIWAAKMVEVANETRKELKANHLSMAIDTRGLIEWALTSRSMGASRGWWIAIRHTANFEPNFLEVLRTCGNGKEVDKWDKQGFPRNWTLPMKGTKPASFTGKPKKSRKISEDDYMKDLGEFR